MEANTSNPRPHRGGGPHINGSAGRGGRGYSKNKTWVSESVAAARNTSNDSTHLGVDGEKWERGGHRGGGRGRGRGRGGRESRSPRPLTPTSQLEDEGAGTDVESAGHTDAEVEVDEPVFESPEELAKYCQEASNYLLGIGAEFRYLHFCIGATRCTLTNICGLATKQA